MQALSDAGKWDEILAAVAEAPGQEALPPSLIFFRGIALVRLGRPAEAISVIERGLAIDPASRWGNSILFEAYRVNNQVAEGFKRLSAFINSGDGYESEKAWYVQWAAEYDMLDVAAEMNAKRDVIRNVPKLPRLALAIQCFCKADTLERVFHSLMALENAHQFSLVIIQDSIESASKRDRYAKGYGEVRSVLSRYLLDLEEKFFSVEYLANKTNMGTAPTCRRLLDYVTSKYDAFVFIEDDCVLAPSALDWAAYHLRNTVSLIGPWFVTCESSYFDKEHKKLDEPTKQKLEAIAKQDAIKNAYVYNDFVNSTCFATTSDIWNICANYRSFTRGPESLTRFVKTKGAKTVAPLVPRCADIGMLHELGYSVTNAGLENVRERKETFVMAEGAFDGTLCKPYDGDKNLFFDATSNLNENAIKALEAKVFIKPLAEASSVQSQSTAAA